jgi:exonuclease III
VSDLTAARSVRLVTWNCRVGGYRYKSEHMARLRPDVLVVQEVEAIDNVLLFGGDNQPTYRDRIADPSSPRGLGIFSYTDTAIRPVDVSDPMGFRRYEVRRGDLVFQIVGTWTWATKSSNTSYKQVHDGIRRNSDWMRQRSTVILGDFNNNESYNGVTWRELLGLLSPLGLVSAYHHHFDEPHGKETRPTHFHGGKETSPFHLDYCFVPNAWTQKIKTVHVGGYNEWRGISDHVPLIVDLEL